MEVIVSHPGMSESRIYYKLIIFRYFGLLIFIRRLSLQNSNLILESYMTKCHVESPLCYFNLLLFYKFSQHFSNSPKKSQSCCMSRQRCSHLRISVVLRRNLSLPHSIHNFCLYHRLSTDMNEIMTVSC